MCSTTNRDFGSVITKLINKQNLSRQETFDAFSVVLNDETSQIQQGAFLAALAAKGETAAEIAGCWEAIYQLDTNKVFPSVNGPIVENSGTGMDSWKTFNISTGASIVAAANGIAMARHGARAITSKCGTVDMAELLGVEVEGPVSLAAQSLEKTNLGLFNGMSPQTHPNALGRILCQISFGSTLNIAASLASPVKADIGVRGVYAKAMIMPVIQVMKEIGYKRAIVVHGLIDNETAGMDEASVSGETFCAELKDDGNIESFSFRPEQMGLDVHCPKALSPLENLRDECKNFISVLSGKGSKSQIDAVALNAGLIFYITGKSDTIKAGTTEALGILNSGKPIHALENWVQTQNASAAQGQKKLNQLRGIQ